MATTTIDEAVERVAYTLCDWYGAHMDDAERLLRELVGEVVTKLAANAEREYELDWDAGAITASIRESARALLPAVEPHGVCAFGMVLKPGGDPNNLGDFVKSPVATARLKGEGQ